MALAEWGLTPAYLNANWTEELLNLMIEQRNIRLALIREPSSQSSISDRQMFKNLGLKVETVNVRRK